jgi:hypothetical protein
MRILHLLSQRELTGAEVYALALARHQTRNGHECLIASDRLNVPCEFPFYAITLDNRRYLNRLRNIRAVRKLVLEERIEMLHAHSRAASWIANIVSRLTGVPYVSTVHGRQSLHFTSRHFNVYGQRIIAICPWLETHLTSELRLPFHRVRMIPNAID